MATSWSNSSLRRSDRGGVSWLTVLILAALAGGVYLSVVWAPIYVVHYEVKQAVRDFMNQAIKNRDDGYLVSRMCMKIASLDSTTFVDPNGNRETVPTVQLDPLDVTWERDTSSDPPMLHVTFEYVREVRYPFLDRVSEWVGTVDMSKEMVVPNWGPAR